MSFFALKHVKMDAAQFVKIPVLQIVEVYAAPIVIQIVQLIVGDLVAKQVVRRSVRGVVDGVVLACLCN